MYITVENPGDERMLEPNNFDHKSKNIAFLIHSKLCGHCKVMMPAWEKFKHNFGENAQFSKDGNWFELTPPDQCGQSEKRGQ